MNTRITVRKIMNVKKIANIIFCFAVLLGIDSLQGEQLNTFPPSASINKQISRVVCEQNKITDRVEKPIIPSVFDLQSYNFLDTTYTFEYLNTLSYEELIELIVTLDWWEIEGLFQYSDDSYEFYSDTLRMHALFDAVEERGNTYTLDDELGIGVLVEVIRSGFYLAFYYDDLNFLRDFDFMDNTIPGMDAISNNPNFGLGTDAQTKVVKAFGAYQGIGMSSIHSLTKSAVVFEDFYQNFESYIDDWYKSNAIYWLGDGVYYSLYTYSYHFNPEDTEFYSEVDSLFNAIANIGLYGTITDQNEWLLNNAVWWDARIGLYDDEAIVVQFLTDVVQLYGEWTGPSLEAIEMLCWLYNCEYADGTPIDEGAIWQSVHDWLLPNRTTYDDETIIFKTGDGVTPEKIETLYWAMKEARAQFHRVSLNDIPLEESNPDDSLIAVIYNSPADYTYNNFLYGLGTNNGGIYIESWGTFFTYERTPQESIYTLEDLFRHEFSHYLQGRYMAPGMWGQDPIYDNERLSWFEEGGAEFLAGSSRLNGIQTRLTMVENIAGNEADRMTLAEVVNATYGNWEFYTYGFAFFDYMYKYRMDMLLEMVEFVKTGDGDSFDILMDEIANSDELNDLYQAHMDSLKANQNNFTDPVTSSLYFEEIENIPTEDIINEISSISQIQNISSETYLSSDHNLLSINGDITLETNNDSDSLWLAMNSNLNNVLASLDEINWNGYNTVNGWFSNPELNTNNQWVYRLDFQCKTSNDLFVTDDVSPKVFALHQNYPNPFNPITSFRYELPEKSYVTIEIYDMLGREVRTLVNTTQDAGFNSVIWNATNDYGKPVSAGVYLYQIQAGEFVQTRKMVLLK
ncbi:MAG TPA: T9SS type A sorting domain-containing protein [Candidatus Marinimicrobia bacterium]|nr:T9SS type A sorting domain-containing protein [Candidatus Neomarinimicrobiota bacterium]